MTSSEGQRVSRIQDLAGHSGRINCLRFGQGSNAHVATGGIDRKVLIWKLKFKNPLLVLNGLANAVESLAFQPAGELVAAGSSSGTVKLWDLAEGKVARTLTGHKQSAGALHFHSSSQIVATGALDGTAKLWDLRQRECTETLRVDSAGVTALHFSPDSRWLATGEQDGTLQLWDVFAGKRISALSHEAHEDQVTSVVFHPEVQLLASGSVDRTCKLWDLETNEIVTSFEHEGKALRTVKFSRDGRALLTSHADAVRVWGWEPTRCYDTVGLSAAPALPSKLPAQPLSAAADLCFMGDQWQLLGASLAHSTASIWHINLQRVEPFRKNEVDEAMQQQGLYADEELGMAHVAAAGDCTGPEPIVQNPVLADLRDGAAREEAQNREPCPLSREAVPDSLPDRAKHPARTLFGDAQARDREARDAQAAAARHHRAPQAGHEVPGEARGGAMTAGAPAIGTPAKQTLGAKPRESPGPRFLAPTASWRLRSQAAGAEAAPPPPAKDSADPGPPASGRPGALFDLSPNKKAGTRSARRSSCGSDPGSLPQPGRPGSPMRLKKVVTQTVDENKHALMMEAGPRSGPAKAPIARAASMTAGSQAKKPWSPSVGAKRVAKGATPDKPSRGARRQPAVGILGVARSSMGTPSQTGCNEHTPATGQQNPSVLGSTAWVVPLNGAPLHTPEAPSQVARSNGTLPPAVAPPSASTVPLAPSLATTSESSSGSTIYGSPLTEELSGPLSSSAGASESQGSAHSSVDALVTPTLHSASGGIAAKLMRSLMFSEQSPAAASQSQRHNLASPAASPLFPSRLNGGAPTPSPLGSAATPLPGTDSIGPGYPAALTPPSAPSDETPGSARSRPGMPMLPAQHSSGLEDSQAGIRDAPAPGKFSLGAGKVSTLVLKGDEGQVQTPVASGTPFTPLQLSGASPSVATGTPQQHPQVSEGGDQGPGVGRAVGASPATPAGAQEERGPSGQGQEGCGHDEGAVVSVRTHRTFSSLQKGAPPAHAQASRAAATPTSFSQFLHASRSAGAGAVDQAALCQPSPVTGLDLASSAVGQEVRGGGSSARGAEGGSGRSSLDADAVWQQLSFRHTEVMSLLAMRRQQLQQAKLLWAGGEGPETMRLLAKWKDPHVLVAVLGAMVTNGDETVQPFSISSRGRGRGMPAASSKADNRWLCIGLAGCVPVLALLKDLLSAPYPFYVETCVQALHDILRCHGQTLHDMHTAPVAPGVDLHRDARQLLCEQCLASLQAMRTPLEALARAHSGTTSTRASTVLKGIDAVLST